MSDFYVGLLLGVIIGAVSVLFAMADRWPDKLNPVTMEWEE